MASEQLLSTGSFFSYFETFAVASFYIMKFPCPGVTTIAGGKWNRGGGHVDGPSEDAKFSSDFDVVYIGSSCSLLVIDRGNKAIREIQLHFDDCAYQYGSGFPLGEIFIFFIRLFRTFN